MDTEGVTGVLEIDLAAGGTVVALLVALQALIVLRLRRLAASARRSFGVVSCTAQESAKANLASAVPERTTADWNRLAHRSRISQLGEMSAAIAHEIRQPLTAIVFTGQAVKRQLANGSAHHREIGEMLDDIVKAGEHAGEIIQRLQAMTRLEPVPFTEIDVNQLARDTLRFFKGDLILRRVEPILELATDLPGVRGDAVQLTQVLGNLIRNACDAMAPLPAHKRTLTLRTYRATKGGVCIAIRDSGPGIDATAMERLFLPFHSAKPNGIGLGLAICRSIVQAHLGEIVGANDPSGIGATFTLTLPAAAQLPNSDSDSHEIVRDHLCCR